MFWYQSVQANFCSMHLDRGNFFILAISLCPPTCTSAYISSKCFPVFFFTFTVSQLTDLLACNAILTKYTEESSTFCCLTHQMTSVAFPNVIYDLKICKLKQSSCDIYALHCVRKKTLTMRWTKETVQNEGAGNLQNYSVFSCLSPCTFIQVSPQLMEGWIALAQAVFPLLVISSRQVAASWHTSQFLLRRIMKWSHRICRLIIKHLSPSIYLSNSADFKQWTFDNIYCLLGDIFSPP